ncbi:MAG: hypothetical protein F4Z00_09800 [Acidimicrobiaceae bacterium]|nr:hypothetical protein [Acidimicrobiaceae bacterium]MXZ65828.1 hypothetical protein [Acidimicrobiaceae bacterium]MYF32162.1 hypothetical protein [Acidimicrobiaceae bacterium]MYG77412.1 hypothetical protein [Acidimicrobiaceae bacterium]MYJ29826.1 hypothetical protein [Acidimicrobiaceae bacterium]
MSTDLVTARRERVLDAMTAAGVDVLVLGRQDNAGYVCGMRRLWTAGTRPFGAGCIVVGATGRVHALSSWDDGIEPPMSFDDLYPLTWNPRIMAASMAAIDGLAGAGRIGVDELTPSFDRAAAHFAPDADVVAADDLMAGVRRHKLPGEVEAIARACRAAWVGAEAALNAGESADPVASAIEALAARGVTVPSSGIRAERRGDGLSVDIGVIRDLYEGGVGGVFVDGRRAGSTALADACRDGATHADLAAAATANDWLVRGLGMGFERPVIGPQVGLGERLEADMVLSVTDGNRRDVIHVTASTPVVLSARP